MYKFKEIGVVPPSDAFIDIVLSRTQRKTPTVVHPGYKISRIRNFYLRKIKFAQTTFNEKFTVMLTEFPRIDEIHPFYADLCNVLYDKDHYKLALGQVNTVKNIIDGITKDYVRMMKFADSLYRCKMLKRAALGRMCTAMKKLGPTLKYLDEVRQHLGRLPSINPTTRTLIMTGYPNVGKSSFMNTVTQANVDVQPYAFTTKSLYVGHMDYQYCRWQVIDTPGILDHPLEERNTIEMTAITALAHVPATILFFVDISETCGYTLKQQASLFESLKPLFRNKPLLVVVNKIDLKRLEDLSPEEMEIIQNMVKDFEQNEGRKIEILPISCATKANVDEARKHACDLLLGQRVQNKVNNSKAETIKNRIQVIAPTASSVNKKSPASSRAPLIPDSFLKIKANPDAEKPKVQTEKDIQEEMGGAGVYSSDWRKTYMLAKDEWKYDDAPQIFDGMNVADFIDENIMEKLAKLEEEERQELAAEGLQDTDEVLAGWAETEKELKEMHMAIRFKRRQNMDRKASNLMGQGGTERKSVKSLSEVKAKMEDLGLKPNEKSLRGRSRNMKRQREDNEDDNMGVDTKARSSTKSAVRSKSKVVGHSIERKKSRITMSMKPENQEGAERKKRKMSAGLAKDRVKARQGEADRHVPDFKPKHLFSGKRGKGKTDRR